MKKENWWSTTLSTRMNISPAFLNKNFRTTVMMLIVMVNGLKDISIKKKDWHKTSDRYTYHRIRKGNHKGIFL